MCTTVYFDGKRLDTVEELEAAIAQPPQMIPDFAARGHPIFPGECLCWVDVAATAWAIGKKVRPGWDEAGCDWIIA